MADFNPVSGFQTRFRINESGKQGGPVIIKGAQVHCNVTASIEATKETFFATPNDKLFHYEAGHGAVIIGWDQGALGMREGEVRELIIPAEEGYGKDGFKAWGVPPKTALNFVIEAVKITPPKR